MLPFRLTVLGDPELRGPDGDPFRFRTRKHLALLVYLALHPGQPHRRDRLATLLWSGADMEEARHSLATALSVLRGRLGADALDTSRDVVRLLPGRVATDLPALEADGMDDPDLAPLGPFLDEFDVPDAPEFQRWRDGTQARLLPALCACLERRIDRCRRTGDTRRMEGLADQLHRLDPLSEQAARARIEARALAGDRIGALRVFDRWRGELAEELGAHPSLELSRMADRLRRRGLDAPAAAPLSPVPTEHWKERVFVGRGAEYAACYAAWERTCRGEPRHILVRGESGSGKTTLVERLVTSVALEGTSVARVPCYELERELPFGVIGGVVTQLLDLPGASATPPDQLAELGRLVAKVRQRWPTLPAPMATVGEDARIRFTEAVLALLTALAEEQPVALVVDDIHLSDATSLAVLHLVLRRIETLPVMMLLTSSSRGEQEPPSARRFLENAESLAMAPLVLRPLPPAHSAELLESLLARDADPGPTVRRALLAGAAGNPMVLELLVADWRRRGDASLALSLGAMTDGGSGAAGAPREALRQVVEGTLAVLDAEARAVVELGAILGQRLNDLSMYTLVDLPVARTMRAMTTLTSHRVLRDAGSHLEFANEYMRGQCYGAMAAPMRRMLHSLVADRLLAQDGADEPIPGLEVAWHLVRGDRLVEAVPYLLAGGRESIRRGAPHEADLALSTGMPALTGAARRTAILLLTEALQELGRWADSLRVLDTPCEPYTDSEERCREVLRVIARRWNGSLAPQDIKEETQRLLDIAAGDYDIEVRVKAVAATVRLLTLSRDKEDLDTLEETVKELGHEALDNYQKLHVILSDAWVNGARRDLKRAAQLLDYGVELALNEGIRSSIAVRLLLGQGNVRCLLGNYQESLSSFETATVIANKLDNLSLQGECAVQLAVAAGRLGRVRDQCDNARRAVDVFSKTDWSPGALAASYELACGLGLTGDFASAQQAIESFFESKPRGLPRWIVQASNLCAADVMLLCGREMKALNHARKAVAVSAGLLNIAYAGLYARWIALLAVKDKTEANGLIRLAQNFTDPSALDPKDRAELLAARLLLARRIGLDEAQEASALGGELGKLPSGIASLLKGLRMLPSGRGGWGIR